MAFALALLLVIAAVRDIQTRRVPNGLAASGLVLGLAGHFWQSGGPGLGWSCAGIAAALPLLLLYALGALGAGDVKLLMAVGALMGPVFLFWTLLGALFAGAGLALLWRTRSPKAVKMPFAPAVALGALGAFVFLHERLW